MHSSADLVRFVRRAFGAAAVSLLVGSGILIALFALRAEDEGWARHSREVSRLGRQVAIAALQRETLLRGQTFTGQAFSRDSLGIGDPLNRARLDSLRLLTADIPKQQLQAERVARLYAGWDSVLDQALTTPATGPHAFRRSAIPAAGRIFPAIAFEINELLKAEEATYEDRSNAAHRIDRMVVIGGVSALAILLVALWLIRQRLLAQAHELAVNTAALDLRNAQLVDQTSQLERQQAELRSGLVALGESEGRFRTLVGSLHDVVFTVGPDLRYTGVYGGAGRPDGPSTPALHTYVGRNAIEILGAEFGQVHIDAVRRALRGEPSTYEWSFPSNGKTNHFVTTLSPLRDEDGHIRGAVGINHDVTEQVDRDRALSEAREQLRAAQRLDALGQLAGGVAHDFNNLLTIVMTYAAILREEAEPNGDHARSIDEIMNASERAAALTRQLLAFSRRQVLKPQPVDLNGTVREVERMLRRVLPPDIALEVNLADELGMVMADPGQIEQVLVNLAINARDAMPDGGALAISTTSVGEGDVTPDSLSVPHVLVTVADSGVGMAPEIAAKVFEPFFTTKQFGRGQGLGLATVHGIVEQSGGRVSVESQPGRGTTFRIRLPRLLDPSATPATERSSPHDLSGAETILLIDDNEELRRVVKRMLMRAGYRVLEAANGAAALAQLDRGVRVDIAISDVMMPEMNGKAVVEAMQQRHRDVKLLLMSGYNYDTALRGMAQRGDIAFIEKPFTAEQLLRKLREVLGQEQSVATR
jgi:signal transduction histidine kinase/ActR/RegA family two-component response regulator